VLLVAAGSGSRLGSPGPKALVALGQAPMLVRALQRFEGTGVQPPAVVTAPRDHIDAFCRVLESFVPHWTANVVPGGAERQESVALGLDALESDTEIVAIHDAARPFVARASIEASLAAAHAMGAATVAIPSTDTILVDDGYGELESTPDRGRLWACQTPQTFQVEVIRAAHAAARKQGLAATDDATVVRATGGRVRLVMGTPLNFKVTTPADLALARSVIQQGLA